MGTPSAQVPQWLLSLIARSPASEMRTNTAELETGMKYPQLQKTLLIMTKSLRLRPEWNRSSIKLFGIIVLNQGCNRYFVNNLRLKFQRLTGRNWVSNRMDISRLLG